jgi:hypothetical protein
MTATLESTTVVPTEIVQTSHGRGPEDLAHIVMLPEKLRGVTTPQAYVLTARVEGFSIKALCGFEWVPQKDAVKLPVCPTCTDIYRADPHGHGDRDRLPSV